MKKTLLTLLAAFVGLTALLLLVGVPAAIRWNVETTLKRDFPHEKITVGRCRWHWPPALTLEYATAGKLRVEDFRADVRFLGRTLFLNPLSFKFIGQKLTGHATILLNKPLRTDIRLALERMPVSALLEAVEWNKKISANGLIDGGLSLTFEDSRLVDLQGELAALSPGGDIVILDQAFLQSIAERAKQPVEIVKASFENYHYNTGIVSLSLADEKVHLGFQLNGEQGKRDLEVTLHDFI